MAGQENPDEGKTIAFKIPHVPEKVWIVSTIFLLIASALFLLRQPGTGVTGAIGGVGATVLTANEAGTKAVDYINKNLVQSGTATLVSTEDFADNMYKVTTSYNSNNIDIYVTKDGKYLFVSAPYDTTAVVSTTTTQPKKTCADMPKAAAAQLDAFIVSGCPYGLQMQRILAEIVKNAPSLESAIKVRYIGAVTGGKVTSMHGDAEATENLRQICIREEQPGKYWPYVSCFMKKQDASDSCLTEAAVDAAKLNACMAAGGKGVTYAQADFALADDYGVTGSPTMIMNGETASEFDFGGRTADAVKTLLCCGFTSQPAACSAALTTAQAATSFSEAYSSGTTAAASSCG